MKRNLLILCLTAPFSLMAQTTHNISVNAMSFSPSVLTIAAGDSVVFTNNSSTHNINGTQITFPSNPESFGNSIGTNWVYGYKFTVQGSYSFKCDVHAAMTGTINVSGVAGISETEILDYTIYPNPANSMLYVKINSGFLQNNTSIHIVLYDITGKQVARVEDIRNHTTSFPLDEVVNGLYFCSIYDGEKLLATEKIARY